ncbi:MAG: multicomponent Na+:H+ antiporter subunit MnhG [Bacteroidetes bacterium HLUCCA01]|nr:MAG: multicomponent Na+:H+ antiporter subunit MnhG [Bacteroidetes bacterium HLUCCA01]
MPISHIIASVALIAGAFFTLVAAIGVVRLPDILMRMHASTKAGTLGTGFILLAVAVTTPDFGVITRAIATILFLVVTAPVAAHLIGRASYQNGNKLWKNTIVDELQDHIDKSKK